MNKWIVRKCRCGIGRCEKFTVTRPDGWPIGYAKNFATAILYADRRARYGRPVTTGFSQLEWDLKFYSEPSDR